MGRDNGLNVHSTREHIYPHSTREYITSVCNWEQGNRIPKTETIKEIAEVLNVDYTYFKVQE